MRNSQGLFERLPALGLVITALGALAACNSHAVEPFSENIVAEQIEGVQVGGANKVDILWVVDNSGSMCEEQASLRENFDAFMEKLIEVGVDYHMAVITTDMEDPLESGRFQNIPDGEPGASCQLTVDVSQCPSPENGGVYPPLVIRADDPQYLKEDGTFDLAKLKLHFGCNATTGTRGSGFEMGLESVHAALSPDALETYNSGFLRPDAYLAVIFITDENDCSDRGALEKVNGNICEWEDDKLVPVQDYVDFLTELKGGVADKVITAGIIAPDSGLRYEYGQDVDPSCITDSGRGFSGYRYQDLIDAFYTDGTDAWCRGTSEAETCAISNICDPPFDGALRSLSKLLVEKLDNKCLGAEPPTCESPADCDGKPCEARGAGGRKFCEPFRVQIEILRPKSEGNLEGRECSASGDNIRCILNEGAANDYTVNYADSACTTTGMSAELNYELGLHDELVVRYPRAVK